MEKCQHVRINSLTGHQKVCHIFSTIELKNLHVQKKNLYGSS